MGKKAMEEWRIQGKKADFYGISQRFHITPYVARILRNRDIIGDTVIENYLYGGLEQLHPAEKMKDLEKAAELLTDAVKKGKRIRIIGDYDGDGVCSIAVLYRGLEKISARVDWTIPDRIKDGYGLNMSFVEDAHRDGIQVLLTCDNGIAALEPVARAKEYGLTVVITDHHELPREERDGEQVPVIPVADAVVDPKQPDCPYPYQGLCGAGIAWKLAGRLLEKNGVEEGERRELMGELLEYAGIATVTDICDLTDENRIIVKEALVRLRETRQPGLDALIRAQGAVKSSLSSYTIGFVLGPALNASGRLDTARNAVELLLTRDTQRAEELAKLLKDLNDRRKDMTVQGVRQAEEIIEREGLEKDKILVVFLPDCHESLAGIIAGRIRETYGRPAIVLTRARDGLKGSGRSTESYHMFQGLTDCREYLSRFGGHPMAAGLSLEEQNLEPFRQALNERCGLTEEDLIQKVWIDLPLPFEYVTPGLIRELELLEPFGKGNTKPIFGEKDLEILSMRIIGRNGNVLRMALRNPSGTQMEAVCFQDVSELLDSMEASYGKGAVELALSGRSNPIRINVTYYPEWNTYGGQERLQAVITRCRMKKTGDNRANV